MASGKRIFGTVLFTLAVLTFLGFLFLLYAKSQNDPGIPFLKEVNLWVLVTAVILLLVVIVLFLLLLVRSSEERKRRAALNPDEDALAAERARLEAYENSLVEPDNLGKGPDIVVYNLPTIPHMYRAWEKKDRKTKVVPYVFPRTVESAVYTNSYIPIDNQGTQLKMRILIAGPPEAQKKELPIKNSQKPKTEVDPKKIPEHLRARLFPEESAAQELMAESSESSSTTTQTVEVTTTTGGSRAYLQELDATIAGARKPKAASETRAYYDYAGDTHEVEEIEGIGRIYGQKLRDLGIETTARLAYEEAEDLARRMQVPVKTVEQWKSMAELIKVKGVGKQYAEAMARAGIQGIAELKKRSGEAVADQVNAYLDSLETNVLGTKITAKRVEGWQKAASGMKRVRLKVPEK
ncbi:MAG: hypothetical protein QOD77_2030 [Thermoplasmata archaeon]|jgi:predicted flap endonuclease-1-like 5' DNA nuclease|nr:hypothetical protein [Thermoplasmata archaeon]